MDNYSNNLEIETNEQGLIITNDEDLNRILRETEKETGLTLSAAVQAVSFGEDPDEKTYLVLLYIYPNDELNEFQEPLKEWSIKTGRQDTYDFLKDLVKFEAIDPNKSFIMVADKITEPSNNKENVIFNDSKPITVFRFLKAMREGNMVLDGDEEFDVNEFDLEKETGDPTIFEV